MEWSKFFHNVAFVCEVQYRLLNKEKMIRWSIVVLYNMINFDTAFVTFYDIFINVWPDFETEIFPVFMLDYAFPVSLD